MTKAFEELAIGLNLNLNVIDEDTYREAARALLEMGWTAEDRGAA